MQPTPQPAPEQLRSQVSVRRSSEQDRTYIARLNFLTDVLGEEDTLPGEHFLADYAMYVRDWQASDGLIADDGMHIPLGGLWWVWGTEDRHGYGFIDPAIPEVAVAVEAFARGRGVATKLFQQAFSTLAAEGVPAVSLAVAQQNHSARGLYEHLGFRRAGAHVQEPEGYLVMQRPLQEDVK